MRVLQLQTPELRSLLRGTTDVDVGERRREWLRRSHLYLVCEGNPAGNIESLLRAALQGGVEMVQLRDKRASDGEIVRAGRLFRKLCDAYDALFIVNDRPDLAMACAADGVHVGQEDVATESLRAAIGDDMLIGVSTHSREQVDAVSGADYFAVGPVYATPTKPTYEPVGTELVRYAAEVAQLPFFAIGGIDRSNVDEVIATGAERVACVRAIRDADDPRRVAEELHSRTIVGSPAGS